MSKRFLIFAVGLMVILATAGCFDLFAVPGVAVSPDGSQVYFLASAGEETSQMATTSLSSVSINGGQPTAITTGDNEDLTSAFAVNPTNGDLAFVQTTKANGTQVMVYSGGSAHELVGSSAFGGLGVGTMMRYSPDGSQIALTMAQFPPDVTIDSLEADSNNQDVSQFQGVKFVLYLINPADGSLKTVSDGTKEATNTVAWSPDSKLLAYNAWVDGNADGKISTMPNFDFASMAAGGPGAPSDNSQIRVYDVGSGAVKPIDSQTIDYGETFISNTEVAYVSLNFGGLMASSSAGGGTGAASVMAYDVGSGASRVAYQAQGGGLVVGMALSPDGSQVAWIELPASGGGLGGGSDSSSQPSHLYVGANFDASAGPVVEIPGAVGFPDAPVWTPDGKSILISSTNIFASLVGQMTASFSGLGAAPGSTDTATATTEGPTQKLQKVDLASKTLSTVYEGTMTNSSFFASVIGLATSGAFSDLAQGLGSLGNATATPSS